MMALRTDPEFEIVGEFGRTDESAAYLARERSTGELVALRDPADGGGPVVSRSLNAAVPASSRACPICRTVISDWRRYCSQCGTDLSGVDVVPEGLDDAAVLESVLRTANKPVELLGRMQRSEGGGAVWFGRDQNTGEIVALDLTRTAGDSTGFDVAVTSTLNAIPGVPDSSPARPSVESRQADTPPAGPADPTTEEASDPPAAESQTRICPSCGKKYDGDIRFCPEDGSALRAWAQQDSLIGEIIANRYLVSRRLGQGGMGQVYLARHIRMGRQCAIKVLNRALTNDVSAIGRFSREATNASRINHPNVAHVYDFGETPEHGVYLAMEYVEGEPLSKMIAAGKGMPNERVISIAAQVADALEAAHVEGVVHRDLTPNNIMIARAHDGSDLVKVVDFGIAKASQDMSASLTATGVVIGTPQYMSPEQLLAEPVDGRSDIYSMGCVLFEMLTGGPPFAGGDALNQFTRRLTETPPLATDRNPEVWPELSDVVFRALARQRDDRFESAAAVRQALLDVGPPQARPAPASWFSRRLGRRGDRGSTTQAGTADGEKHTEIDRSAQHDLSSGAIRNLEPASSPSAPVRTDSGTSALPPEPRSAAAPADALAAGAHAVPEDAETQIAPARSFAPPYGPAPLSGADDGTIEVRPQHVAGGPSAGRQRSIPIRPLVAAVLVIGLATTFIVMTKGRQAAPSPPPISDGAPALPVSADPVTPLPGRIRLSAALPANAVVRVDGQPVSTEGNLISLPPGEYGIEVQAPGYEPYSERITLIEDAETAWAPRLLRVASTPARGGGRVEPETPRQNPQAVPRQEREATETIPPPTPPPAAQQDPVVTEPTVPPTFDDVVRSRIETFRAALEAKDLAAVRVYLTQRGISEFTDIFNRAGPRPLAVTVRAMVPDPAGLRTTFLIRIDVAGGGDNLLMWTDFVAGFQSFNGTWRLITVDRSR